MFQICRDVEPPLGTLRPELAWSDAPLRRMLAKDPDERPQSAGAAIDALEAASKQAGHASIATSSGAGAAKEVAASLPRDTALAATAMLPSPSAVASTTEPVSQVIGAESLPVRSPATPIIVGVAAVALLSVVVWLSLGPDADPSAPLASAPVASAEPVDDEPTTEPSTTVEPTSDPVASAMPTPTASATAAGSAPPVVVKPAPPKPTWKPAAPPPPPPPPKPNKPNTGLPVDAR